MTPSSTERIGFTFSSVPAIACARPMRPPFCRYSSVPTVKTTRFTSLNRSTSRSISSSVVPRSRRRWIASASIEQASEAVSESTSRMRSAPVCCASSDAASDADWKVPDSFEVSWIDQMRS